MIDALRDALTGMREYDELPDSIKAVHSPQEYLWLSDAQKGRLMQDETEPEWSEP